MGCETMYIMRHLVYQRVLTLITRRHVHLPPTGCPLHSQVALYECHLTSHHPFASNTWSILYRDTTTERQRSPFFRRANPPG